jgi:hypothetical protein
MPISIDVKFDVQAALRRNKGRERAVRQAAVRALNRTAQQVQTASVKAIARETGLKQKDVRVAMRRLRAKPSNLVATVIATGKAVNLIRFTRQTRRAARRAGGVIANAWGRKRLYRGTFIGNAGRTVFARTSKARLPIEPKYGPSVPRELAREYVAKFVRQTIRTSWPINFQSDLKYYLGRVK